MALRNKAFHQLRQLFQQHTARWQHELPNLTKPQYAVMRAIADKPWYRTGGTDRSSSQHQSNAGRNVGKNGKSWLSQT